MFRFPDIDLIAECSRKPHMAIAFNFLMIEDLKISNAHMKKSILTIDDYFNKKTEEEIVVFGSQEEAEFYLKQEFCEQIGLFKKGLVEEWNLP